mmetsp:Transcript_15545/g.38735  ORF Transcript_15545/g.38735 Transcript_15545/m.38735 type:complete len:300 (-) Transcript_15545:196-1095(-)
MNPPSSNKSNNNHSLVVVADSDCLSPDTVMMEATPRTHTHTHTHVQHTMLQQPTLPTCNLADVDDDSNRSTFSVTTKKKQTPQQNCVYVGDVANLPQKKSVTFKPTVRAKLVLPLAEYTEQEVHDCWYTEQDLHDIRKGIDRTVRTYRRRCRIQRDAQQKAQQQQQEEEKEEPQQRTQQDSDLADSADDNGDDASSVVAVRGTDHSASLPSSYVHRFHRDGVYTEEIRGIERKTKVGLRMRTRHRMDASQIVCIAQQVQWDLGIYDPEYMSESYIDVTKVCQDDAYRMGLLDEQEARRA